MTAVRLTLTGSGFFVLAGTVAVVLGLGYRHPVREAPPVEGSPSKLAQAIERAAPELLDPTLTPQAPEAPPPEVFMPPDFLPRPTRAVPPVVRAKPSTDLGYVRVSTQPWGWASVGRQRIETIGSGRLALAPGRHTITIYCAECTPHRTVTREVTVKSNMTELILISWDEERARERAATLAR